MRSVRVAVVAVVISAAAAVFLGGSPSFAAAVSVYASPTGSGSACSATVPCSLAQAQATVRGLTPAMTSDVDLVLGGGTYAVSTPIVLGPQDSGQNGHRVVWQAAAGQAPVISGGVPVTGWTQSASVAGLWSAPVATTLQTRQLYANGRRLPRTSGASPVALTQTATGFTASSATMSTWRNPTGIEFVFDGGNGAWTQPRCDVASISGTAITMKQPCFANLHLPSGPAAPDGDNPAGGFPGLSTSATPTSIENAYELLSPGHWYLDQGAHVMYYQAAAGESVPAMSFVVASAQQLVTTASTPDNPLHDVTIQGLDFAYATWLQPSGGDGFAEMQANATLTGTGAATAEGLCTYTVPTGSCPFASWTREPAAVDLAGTQRVSVLGNRFEHLGGAGLAVFHGATTDLIQGNDVSDVSGNGIELGSMDDPQPTAFSTDLAQGKPATQSSVNYSGDPARAVDGNTDGAFFDNSVSHTDLQAAPWWQVDLGAAKPIWSVNVFNRTDCCADRLTDYWVFASSTPFNTSLTPAQQATQSSVWSSHQTGQAGRPTTIPADTTARYVMVQLTGTNYLSLAEVQVMSGTEILTGNTIADNHVHNVGAEFTGAVGILGGYSRSSTITHNQVDNLPYSGISFGWGGWHTNVNTPTANPNINQDNVISDNLIFKVMQTRSDGGAIYTNGSLGTSLQHGLLLQGNVTFGNRTTNNAYYQDEGSSYVTIDGNAQYLDPGNFNGGCSTTGHFIIKNNYHVGALNGYGCDNVGSDFQDGGGNVAIVSNPGPGVIPSALLSAAGLEAAYTSLTTSSAPVVVAVGPISGGQALISGSGFTSAATVTLGGVAASAVSHLSSTHLIATFTATAGQVQVTTTAGASALTGASFTADPSRDAALGHAATESSVGFGGTASRADDGNTDGNYFDNSVSHTNQDVNAWWQVDLGAPTALTWITVWNRTDGFGERLTDYWLFVSATPFNTALTPAQQSTQPGVWSSHQSGQAGSPTLLTANTTGRYVMVQLSGTNYLALAEVQTFD